MGWALSIINHTIDKIPNPLSLVSLLSHPTDFINKQC